MGFNFHKRLVVQLSLFVSIVSIVTITYLSSFISHQQSESTVAQLKQEAVVLAENLAASTSSYVITRNYTSIEEILLRAAQFKNITEIQVIDTNGKPLSNVVKDEYGEITPLFKKILFELPHTHELSVTQSEDAMLIWYPIILGDVVGWVRSVYSLDGIKQVKVDIWVNNLTYGFFITVITIVILIFLIKPPIVSIRKYTNFADSLNEFRGDTIQVDKRSIELSRLGNALNSASMNLHTQHSQLQTMLNNMENIAAIAEYSPDIVLSIGTDNFIEYINMSAKTAIRELFSSNSEQRALDLLPENLDDVLKKCESKSVSLCNIESTVKGRNYLWKFTRLRSQGVVHCHGVDITEKVEAQEKLEYQANYDDLTGLPNRVLAMDRLRQAIIRSKRLKNHVGVLFLDVDRFKTVIDTLGHGQGDEIIKLVASRLKTCLREGDSIARFGGDVFLIVLNDLRQALDVKVVAEKAIEVMRKDFFIDGQKFHLGLSVGISSCPDDDTNEEKLIRNADIALHKSKESGGDVYQFYTSEFNDQVMEKVEIESELRNALENSELFLTYQPQIDITNNRIIGAEALIRWINDKLGFVPPDRFISIAEDTGLIIPIGEWVLRTACIEAKKWQKIFSFPLRVAVNVSARQFTGKDFSTMVKRVLEESGLPPVNLELEMTESLLAEDVDEIMAEMNRLKDIGVTLALDDFGTGYSSLSYLKRFPFDILKIDRAFVEDVIENPDDASLCKAIVAIANSLNLKVIGEGVETKEQMNFLRAIGTDIAQGYYYSKSLEAQPFIDYVNDFKP